MYLKSPFYLDLSDVSVCCSFDSFPRLIEELGAFTFCLHCSSNDPIVGFKSYLRRVSFIGCYLYSYYFLSFVSHLGVNQKIIQNLSKQVTMFNNT